MKLSLSQQASGFAVSLGCVVLAGWIFDVEALKRVAPGLVFMKATTAFSFILAGGAGTFLPMSSPRLSTVGAMFAVGHVFLMLALLVAAQLGVSSGLERVFFTDSADTFTVAPGVPSLCTMAAFLLVGAGGLTYALGDRMLSATFGGAAILSGGVSLIGYAMGRPELYCYLEGRSTAMAVHTAVGMVVLGVAAVTRPERATLSEG